MVLRLLDFARWFLVGVVVVGFVCFRGFAFVAWGGSERRCCLSRSVGLEGGGKGGGGLGCSVVVVGFGDVEALRFGNSFWVCIVIEVILEWRC